YPPKLLTPLNPTNPNPKQPHPDNPQNTNNGRPPLAKNMCGYAPSTPAIYGWYGGCYFALFALVIDVAGLGCGGRCDDSGQKVAGSVSDRTEIGPVRTGLSRTGPRCSRTEIGPDRTEIGPR